MILLMPNENLENKESLKYNISHATENILLDNSCDPNSNYFNTQVNFDVPYVILEEFHSQFKNHVSVCLPFLHINKRSINKHFEVIPFFVEFYIWYNLFL